MRTEKLALVVLALGVIATGGCAVKSYTADGFTAETAPIRVAVLPFYPGDETSRKDGVDKILRQCFYNFFANLGYDDIKPQEVDELLEENEVDLSEPMSNVDLAKFSEILDVDAVIYGVITKASNVTLGVYSETTIEARITMVDVETGETLWTVEHSESKIGGFVPTIGFMIETIGTQLENMDKELIYTRIADEFSRRVVECAVDPGPVRAAALSAPTIDGVATNAKFIDHFSEGDRIIVVMKGSRDMKATFNIGNWRMGIPMTEIPPGTYTGAYDAAEGDYIEGVLITCQLVDKDGNAAKKTCLGAEVAIGTRPLGEMTADAQPDESEKGN